MSASLVGSEMCIRDRPKRGPTIDTRSSRGAGSASCLPQIPNLPTNMGIAVSYTHLTLPTICSV
eukprot:7474375-Alexandrium_andersonii.AAC.1